MTDKVENFWIVIKFALNCMQIENFDDIWPPSLLNWFSYYDQSLKSMESADFHMFNSNSSMLHDRWLGNRQTQNIITNPQT